MVREDTLRGVVSKKLEAFETAVAKLIQLQTDLDRKLAPIRQDIRNIEQRVSVLEGKAASWDNLNVYTSTLDRVNRALDFMSSQQQPPPTSGQVAPPPVAVESPPAEQRGRGGSSGKR